MPGPLYKHDCCEANRGTLHGRKTCPHCGSPGEFVRWSRSVVEHWGRFQRTYGLKAMGPSKSARALLSELRAECHFCDGSGFSQNRAAWSYCRACGGSRGFWVGSPDEVKAAYERISNEHPDALVPGAPDVIEGAVREAGVTHWIFGEDRFEDHLCIACGLRAAPFSFRGMAIGPCPGCLLNRIDTLEKALHSLPWDVAYLRGEAEEEVGGQRERIPDR